jgi:hypothetical protein
MTLVIQPFRVQCNGYMLNNIFIKYITDFAKANTSDLIAFRNHHIQKREL